MDIFNQSSRTKNVLKSSIIGACGNIINVLMGFIYRSIFLHILSAEYLGINGLFTNVLQVLSLAELGITTAITYRFYEPISKNDVSKVSRIMVFFKYVYRYIAIFITVIGLLILPFVDFLIKDTSEIPNDVNLQLVYLLFLFNTVSSYLFVYKQTLLSADQKNYIVSIFNFISLLVKYIIQLIFLILCEDYVLTLAIGIFTTVVLNYVMSLWVSRKYKPIFIAHENLSKEERSEIINDTKACMLHKIGATVKTGTDNIVLTKMISLVATGLYSNYSLIITSVQSILNQLLGNFVSSIGSAQVNLDKDEQYKVYRNLLFINWWLCSAVTGCTFLLLDDFICMWLGEIYLLDKITVILLCCQFYIFVSRLINISYTNACGLFVRDRIRPVIEAVLNLGFSIYFAYYFNIAGVFLGTIVSSLLTVFWREPIILFKYEFKRKVSEYWKDYLEFLIVTIISCIIVEVALSLVVGIKLTWTWWILEAIFSFVIINLILILFFHKKKEFDFLKKLVLKYVEKTLRRVIRK